MPAYSFAMLDRSVISEMGKHKKKIPGKPGSTLIFKTAHGKFGFKINKYYWRTKSCNKADRVVLHDEVRFSIFDRMTETCCRLRPLEGCADK
jgi:hypothetical protein